MPPELEALNTQIQLFEEILTMLGAIASMITEIVQDDDELAAAWAARLGTMDLDKELREGL